MQCGLSMGNMEYMNEVTEEDGEQRFVCACHVKYGTKLAQCMMQIA